MRHLNERLCISFFESFFESFCKSLIEYTFSAYGYRDRSSSFNVGLPRSAACDCKHYERIYDKHTCQPHYRSNNSVYFGNKEGFQQRRPDQVKERIRIHALHARLAKPIGKYCMRAQQLQYLDMKTKKKNSHPSLNLDSVPP